MTTNPPTLHACFDVHVVFGGRLRIGSMRSLAESLKLHRLDLDRGGRGLAEDGVGQGGNARGLGGWGARCNVSQIVPMQF